MRYKSIKQKVTQHKISSGDSPMVAGVVEIMEALECAGTKYLPVRTVEGINVQDEVRDGFIFLCTERFRDTCDEEWLKMALKYNGNPVVLGVEVQLKDAVNQSGCAKELKHDQ